MAPPSLRAAPRLALACLFAAGALAATPRAAAHDADPEEQALLSIVDAELAFARMALEQGIRAAFLANFAPDGVTFEPAPVPLVATWSKRPPNPNPLALKLEWAPAQSGVAKSLDMGYSTGAYKLTDTARAAPPKDGVFFSIWRREASGAWKVALDIGVATPAPVDFVALGPAPRPRYQGRADAAAQQKALLSRESRAFATGGAAASAGTYADTLAPDVRFLRDGAAPIVGRTAAARAMRDRATRVVWTPQDVRVAPSADLAVSYGRYREIAKSGKSQEGYYTHLWLRDATGRWRITHDIALPAP